MGVSSQIHAPVVLSMMETALPLHRKLSASRSQSGRGGEEENF